MLTKTVIENILILLGESFWVFSIYTQLHKLLKTHNRLGLSPVTQTFNAAGNVTWAVYFASRHLWIPFTTNLMMLVMAVTTLGYILMNKRQFSKGIVAILIVSPITSFLLLRFPHISGWLGVTYNLCSNVPWLLHLKKHKKSGGVSHHSLIFDYGAIFCTLAYAILIISFPLIVACILGLVYTTVIVLYYRRYRHNV